MDAIKVYAHRTFYGGTISAAEAKEAGIGTDGLALASIEDLKAQISEGDIGNAYGGPIEVAEGIFEFDFDKVAYVPFGKGVE